MKIISPRNVHTPKLYVVIGFTNILDSWGMGKAADMRLNSSPPVPTAATRGSGIVSCPLSPGPPSGRTSSPSSTSPSSTSSLVPYWVSPPLPTDSYPRKTSTTLWGWKCMLRSTNILNWDLRNVNTVAQNNRGMHVNKTYCQFPPTRGSRPGFPPPSRGTLSLMMLVVH